MEFQPRPLHSLKDKFSFIFTIFLEKKWILIGYTVLLLISSFITTLLPIFTKLQLDQLEEQNSTLFTLETNPLFVFALLLILPFVISLISDNVLQTTQFITYNQLYARLKEVSERFVWAKVATLDAGFFQSKRNIKLFNDALNASRTITGAFDFFTRRLSGLLQITIIIPLLTLVGWQLAGIVFAVALGQLFLSRIRKKKMEGYSLAESRANDVAWKLRQILESVYYELKTMGDVEEVINEYEQNNFKVNQFESYRDKANFSVKLMSWLLDNGLVLIANLFVGYQVLQGEISIGSFVVVVAYVDQIRNFFMQLVASLSEWDTIDLELTKLDFFFSLKSRLRSSSSSGNHNLRPNQVTMQSVDFSYPSQSEEEKFYLSKLTDRISKRLNRESNSFYERQIEEIQKLLEQSEEPRQILRSISLELNKGKIVALVGRNGSGKTTITHVLQHHYEPTAGKIFLDGISPQSYTADDVNGMFSWLTQQPFILERFSIRYNLMMGSPKTSVKRSRMEEVIFALSLDKVISEASNQLETIIDEDVSFSGGEKQLIAIARALIQQRPFIIFDEGSSQLDVEKELLVLDQLQKAKENSGILFITHRMSVARKADYIYVIDDGKIVEEGTHEQLIHQNDGLYKYFWSKQIIE